jgi:membrane protein
VKSLKRHLDRPRELLRRLVAADPAALGRWGRLLAHQVRLWRVVWRHFREGEVVTVAGHLTFKTLLSLIPLLVLALLVINFFAPGPQLSGKVEGVLFDMLNITDIDVMVDGEIVDLQDKIDDMVEAARRRIDAAAAVGIVFLFVIAISVLHTIEAAVNRIWEIGHPRSWWRKFLMFWMFLTLGPPAVAAAVYGSARLAAEAAVLPGWTVAVGSRLAELAAVWLVFGALYKLLPRVRVRWTAALAGALVAGTLWHAVAKEAFVFYIHHTAGYGRLYGNLAVIPIFFLWLYVSWIFILFGCTLAYVVQNLQELSRSEFIETEREGSRFLSADYVALVAAAACARRFRRGEGPAPLDLLVDATGVGPDRLGELLGRLVSAGVLARTPLPGEASAADEPEMAYLPARDPAGITVADVLRAVESAAPMPLDPRFAALGRAVRAAYDNVRTGWVGQGRGATVADLASASESPEPV